MSPSLSVALRYCGEMGNPRPSSLRLAPCDLPKIDSNVTCVGFSTASWLGECHGKRRYFPEKKRGQGYKGRRPNLRECLSQAPQGCVDPALTQPRITGLPRFRKRRLLPPPGEWSLGVDPIFSPTRLTRLTESPLRRPTNTRDEIAWVPAFRD